MESVRKIDILTALKEAEPKYSRYKTKRIDGDKSIHNMLYETACDMYDRCRHAVERAGNKTYEWERLGDNAMFCGQCGKGLYDEDGYGFVLYEFDYCPFCGAKMNKKTYEGGVIE